MNLITDFDLSIIIPHYDSSDLLINLLCTIPNINNIEIIIVDDKSTSFHIENINKYILINKFNNLSFLHNTTDNKGAGVCRNIGLQSANGKWVLFADADDYFTKYFYSIVKVYFKKKYDVIFFIPTSIYIDTGKMALRHLHSKRVITDYISSNGINEELNLRYNMASPCSKMISRELIERNEIIFDDTIASNDVMFSLKVGYYMKTFFVSESIIYVITKNFSSLTSDISEYIYDIRLNILIKRLVFLKKIISKDDLKLLNFYYRAILVKSLRYGIIKFIRVSKVFYDNDINIYDKKFLNPFLILRKVFFLIKNNDIKYSFSNVTKKNKIK